MPTIRLHLENAEYDAVARYAAVLNVSPEAVAYAGLNRAMLMARDPALKIDIVETWIWHKENLPLWSDSACSVHAYEGRGVESSRPSDRF